MRACVIISRLYLQPILANFHIHDVVVSRGDACVGALTIPAMGALLWTWSANIVQRTHPSFACWLWIRTVNATTCWCVRFHWTSTDFNALRHYPLMFDKVTLILNWIRLPRRRDLFNRQVPNVCQFQYLCIENGVASHLLWCCVGSACRDDVIFQPASPNFFGYLNTFALKVTSRDNWFAMISCWNHLPRWRDIFKR